MKKMFFIILIVVLSSFVFAEHDTIPLTSWNDNTLNSFKFDNKCNCASYVERIQKNINPQFDILGLFKVCNNYCTHCDAKKRTGTGIKIDILDCLNDCFTTGSFKTEQQFASCIEGCSRSNCVNILDLKYQNTKLLLEAQKPKEEVKKDVKEPKQEVKQEIKEEPKLEPKPLKVKITEQECKSFANFALEKVKSNLCNEVYTMDLFTNTVLAEFTAVNKRSDYADCSQTIFSSAFDESKTKCSKVEEKKDVKKTVVKKKRLSPLGFVIIIVLAVLSLGVFIFLILKRKHSKKQEDLMKKLAIEKTEKETEQIQKIDVTIPEKSGELGGELKVKLAKKIEQKAEKKTELEQKTDEKPVEEKIVVKEENSEEDLIELKDEDKEKTEGTKSLKPETVKDDEEVVEELIDVEEEPKEPSVFDMPKKKKTKKLVKKIKKKNKQ